MDRTSSQQRKKRRESKRKSGDKKKPKPNRSEESLHPSYTNLQPPYSAICRQRYHANNVLYEQQFNYELKMLELMQNSAYDSMRFHRHFAITTLWPPLHTRKEIEFVLDTFFRHPERQTRRLHEIMKGPVH
ncbi:uncharacterized protein LOC5667250 [Anopheles gambiae]|uniref:Uncharacterized protein n=1 Tax=Anopheles coluzzii TaxID=1518534 RepID=A0A6E8VNX8_ANOCL|nr:uncharacterized protein LOC5667250 [Anopheles gambiae]XP_040225910.2 uncharacterized protein LOC120951319 [Anopheles coluzzii]